MKLMIIGADGQLGSDLVHQFQGKTNLIPLTYEDGDIVDINVVRSLVNQHHPDVIINTAAYHQVPKCEDEPIRAFEVNALGARNLAICAQEAGVKLVHISTDYVFDGRKQHPYTEEDNPNPLNVYANTKLAGEYFITSHCEDYLIARVSGIYGKTRSIGKGSNFINTMLKLNREGKAIRVVTDEILTPTYTVEISRQIECMINHDMKGLFHVTSEGACSWYEFAQEIFNILKLPVSVEKAKVADFPPTVQRPHYSVLENKRLKDAELNIMKDWKTSLNEFLTTTEVDSL
ncbi:dTDP-4-dehydrorhamnose reductase [bacterium]